MALGTPSVKAAQYAVDGTIDFHNGPDPLPAGVTFGDADYDPGNGYLSQADFEFPEHSVSLTTVDYSPPVVMTLSYRFIQSEPASALVDADGNAAFTPVRLKLHVVSAESNTGRSYAVGSTCDFGPVVWDSLAGTASAAGIDLQAVRFSVSDTQDACGGHAGILDTMLAANDNSVSLHLDGDFTPPTLSDRVFLDGFEVP